MPKRTDISSILIIGAGPIVIGQAAEFDYAGSQAVKALKSEGYRVIVVNWNPETIMTDPELSDATYIEPITPEIVARIIEKERPDALLPTMGGQTALNTALALFKDGTLERLGTENMAGLADTLSRYGIDADFHVPGEITMALTDHQVPTVQEAFELHRDHGVPVTLLDAAQARARVDSPRYLGGFLDETVGLVDPARLVIRGSSSGGW